MDLLEARRQSHQFRQSNMYDVVIDGRGVSYANMPPPETMASPDDMMIAPEQSDMAVSDQVSDLGQSLADTGAAAGRAVLGGVRDAGQGFLDLTGELAELLESKVPLGYITYGPDGISYQTERPEDYEGPQLPQVPRGDSAVENLSRGLVQFAAGMAAAPLRGAGMAVNMGRGAFADALFDPTEGNLSTMLKDLGLESDVVNYLDSQVDEEAGAGERLKARMKQSLEGMGLGALVDSTMAAFKAARSDEGIKGTIRNSLIAAGNRAQARLDEAGTGTTLTSGVDLSKPVDQALVAAGRAVTPALSDVEQNVRAKFPDVDLDFYGDKDKGYTLSKIIVPKNSRKQGVGKAVMSELTQAADNEGAVIKLTPSKDFGATSTARLKKFYKQFGFVENKGRYKDFSIKETMYRLPVEKEINASIKPPTDNKPGIVAFHGSGADFDEFKLEKIGTGEGNQAYGYGLYFAEKEDIAKFYKDTVGQERNQIQFKGKPLDSVYTVDIYENFGDDISEIIEKAKEMGVAGGDEEVIEDAVIGVFAQISQGLSNMKDAQTAVDSLRSGRSTGFSPEKTIYRYFIEPFVKEPVLPEGKMYKVGLQPNPEDMLDHQIPLQQQPEAVQDKAKQVLKLVYPNVETPALTMAGFDLVRQLEMRIDDSIRNQMTQQRMVIDGKLEPKMTEATMDEIDKIVASKIADTSSANTQSAPKIASEIMLELGIPGIKYRDAGSRGGSKTSKDATFNYVVFDDKAIKILEKYGVVGPVGVSALAAKSNNDDNEGGI